MILLFSFGEILEFQCCIDGVEMNMPDLLNASKFINNFINQVKRG